MDGLVLSHPAKIIGLLIYIHIMMKEISLVSGTGTAKTAL
jgi:hypothetical protein